MENISQFKFMFHITFHIEILSNLKFLYVQDNIRSRVIQYRSLCFESCAVARTCTLLIYSLTLFRPMEFSIKLHTIKSAWSIVYIEGSQVIISKIILHFPFAED